jgi:hypothetical protein
MDNDTIFPVLSNGERIMGKYRNTASCRQCVETIVILTNFRLLIRWKHRICCCYARSYYSSILLDSIDRIDETHNNRNWHIFSFIIGLHLGLIAIILGIVLEIVGLIVSGIVVIISTMIPFVLLCFCLKRKFITLIGSFGSETMRFDKVTARELEAQLSEMIHQRRIRSFVQQDPWYGPPSSGPSLPIVPMTYIDNETTQNRTAKKYIYDSKMEHF